MEEKFSWKGNHWERAPSGNFKPKNPNPKPHSPTPLMGHSLPFYSSKTQTEAPLRKMLKNMKIAASTISKQLFTLQIGIDIEVQTSSAQSPNFSLPSKGRELHQPFRDFLKCNFTRINSNNKKRLIN